MKPLWDIFCSVVDNLGDAGVCWRLARQLAREHPIQPRLWIDQPETLARLVPAYHPARPVQEIDGVTVVHWQTPFSTPFAIDRPAEVVIEAFACSLPQEYLAAMASCPSPPQWVNLEYLSAEPWVSEFHQLPSPHPRLPLKKYFFFPGFVPSTGGLLREHDLLGEREKFNAAEGRQQFLTRLGVPQQALSYFTVSLFCYATAPAESLLQTWAAGSRPVLCLQPTLAPNLPLPKQTGNLLLCPVPFLPQAQFDPLLWSCDLNLVRGEDSFVRAQWAARPFVWNIYPQAENVHLEKLKAFLDAYGAGLPYTAQKALLEFSACWNSHNPDLPAPPDLQACWHALIDSITALATHADHWCQKLARQQDLASALVKFTQSGIGKV